MKRSPERRPTLAASVSLAVLGVAHLLAPRVLLATASQLYRVTLGVRFEPTERSPRRVRLIGVCMVATGVVMASLLQNDAD